MLPCSRNGLLNTGDLNTYQHYFCGSFIMGILHRKRSPSSLKARTASDIDETKMLFIHS